MVLIVIIFVNNLNLYLKGESERRICRPYKKVAQKVNSYESVSVEEFWFLHAKERILVTEKLLLDFGSRLVRF